MEQQCRQRRQDRTRLLLCPHLLRAEAAVGFESDAEDMGLVSLALQDDRRGRKGLTFSIGEGAAQQLPAVVAFDALSRRAAVA